MLVHEPVQRHHAGMIAPHAATPTNVAEHLRDDEIDVWHLRYRPQEGRAPLRRLLSAYLRVDADELGFVEGRHGRPALASGHDQSLGFNWSHSGTHAAVAIGRHIAPGIDIEQKRDRPRALDIAQRFFCAEEAAALAAVPAHEASASFLELWTAKEAVLKALGRGLAFGLDRISIACEDGRLRLRRLDDDRVDAWQLHQLLLDTSLTAAVAWRGGTRHIRLWTLASDG
jgi:4'-phosphopantetheinyl transferase